MDRLLAYQNAGVDPPAVVLGPHPDGPADLLDEPVHLSLADKANLGIQFESSDGFDSDRLQWELRMALERIHTIAGHSEPIGGVAPAENKPFDGMDPVSSAMLLELANTVMPDKPQAVANDVRYSPAQRKVAIKRWMEKRARRHLTSQTKYRKMKDVAVSKARCKGGKFIKKSERERMAREAETNIIEVKQEVCAAPAKGVWGQDAEWQTAYNFYAQHEE